MANREILPHEPDYTVVPGDILSDTIYAMGMTQAELARRMGRPKKTINEIVKGITAITPDTALQLEKVLGIPASFWINLESNYQKDQARTEENKELRENIEWLNKFPIKEITKRGYLKETDDSIEQMRDLLRFFGVASTDSWEEVWTQSIALRKSEAYKVHWESLISWIRMVEIEAAKIDCKPFNRTVFKNNLLNIRDLTTERDPKVFIDKLKQLCADSGVAVVFMPELEGSRVSGVTKWLSSNKAMIGLSLRYKSNDQLWFTFFHEAGHILLHGKKKLFIEKSVSSSYDKEEKEANEFATNLLIPKRDYKQFISSTDIFSHAKVVKFAKKIGIAPGIVVGRLQYEKRLPYNYLNGLKIYYEWTNEGK